MFSSHALPRPVWPVPHALLLLATVWALVALGHDGRRIAQLLLLAAPVFVWQLWPLQTALWQRIRWAVTGCVGVVLCLDGVTRGYLMSRYGAAPDSTVVLTAMANTHSHEGLEYALAHWRSVGAWVLLGVSASALVTWLANQGARGQWPSVPWQRMVQALMVLAVLLCLVAHASKPWRRLQPAVFWTHWAHSVEALQAQWGNYQQVRQAGLAQAKGMSPVIDWTSATTVVLVITDSINRDNMSLYGYPRDTTPKLRQQAHQLQDHLAIWEGWSLDASTLPSIRRIMSVPSHQPSQPPAHLVALARAAGYKVWWMSNHDDLAVDQEHGRYADVVETINRQPGRSSSSLDEELLDCLQEALADPSRHKLVVVHLMGAHPHYRMRHPDNWPAFQPGDAVDAHMAQQDRPEWLIKKRHAYDRAVSYHDSVVNTTLALVKKDKTPYRAWMYLSDHGQEVGHEINHAGHSPTTLAGYKIPAMAWRNTPAMPQAVHARALRTDWASLTLSDLLHLTWQGQPKGMSALQADYAWQAPALPVAATSP